MGCANWILRGSRSGEGGEWKLIPLFSDVLSIINGSSLFFCVYLCVCVSVCGQRAGSLFSPFTHKHTHTLSFQHEVGCDGCCSSVSLSYTLHVYIVDHLRTIPTTEITPPPLHVHYIFHTRNLVYVCVCASVCRSICLLSELYHRVSRLVTLITLTHLSIVITKLQCYFYINIFKLPYLICSAFQFHFQEINNK